MKKKLFFVFLPCLRVTDLRELSFPVSHHAGRLNRSGCVQSAAGASRRGPLGSVGV